MRSEALSPAGQPRVCSGSPMLETFVKTQGECHPHTSAFHCMIRWLPDPGMRPAQMHEKLFIRNNNICTALSSIVPAELIDTPFTCRFLLITRRSARSAWLFCVALFVLLGHSCQKLFISSYGYLLVKIMPHSYIRIPCDQRRGRAPFFFFTWPEF